MAADLHNITSPVAKVSTSAPTYTDGDVAGLSLATDGSIRVSISSGGTDQDVNLVGINGAAPVVGHGVAAAALRVELPTDGTGVVGLIAGSATIGGVTPVASALGGYTYAHIAAGQATTVVKGSPGTLHSITFNGPAAATNVTTVYDHASSSGTVIAIPLATAVVMPVTVIYDIAFPIGLTIITTTANGADMTVAFK